jgi:hypothetical protein
LIAKVKLTQRQLPELASHVLPGVSTKAVRRESGGTSKTAPGKQRFARGQRQGCRFAIFATP